MKKNVTSLVMSIIGAVFALIGTVMWAACSELVSDLGGNSTGYTVGFVLLGLGGGVLSLIGGIQAYSLKKSGKALSVIGLLLQIGNLILQCMFIEKFSFSSSLWTILAIIMFAIGTLIALMKANN